MKSLVSMTGLALVNVLCVAACASSSDATDNGGQGQSGGARGIAGGVSSIGGARTAGGGGATAAGGGAGATGSGGSLFTAGGGGGAPAASGGANSGGSSGGAGGASDTLFGRVNALVGARCAGSKCHSNGGMQLPFASASGGALYSLFTTPIPDGTPHCVGITLVKPGDASSPLLQVVATGGKIACTKPKKESIGPMPDDCATATTDAGKCLTPAEVKILSDWVLAGAPQN